MATKAVADSSAMGGQEAVMRFTRGIMQSSHELGQVLGMDREIDLDLRQEGLSFDTAKKTMELAHRVNNLIGAVDQYQLTLGSEAVSSVDGLARALLTSQLDTFKEEVEHLKANVRYIFNDVTHRAQEESAKLLPVFEKAVGQYLQTRNFGDSEAAQRTGRDIERLRDVATELTAVRDQWAGREIQPRYQEDPAQERFRNLRELVSGGNYYGYSYESVLLRLDEVLTGEDKTVLDERWGMNKDRINQAIDNLHEEVGSDQVNGWVWKLLGEKAGENYGVVHRYDDLGILKEAILRTTKSLADKIMKEEAVGLDQEAVFAKLYEIIGEPQVENPMAWMKGNVCYYTQKLHQAIQEVKFPRRQFDVFENFNEQDDFSSFSHSSTAPHLTFDPSQLCSLPIHSEPEKLNDFPSFSHSPPAPHLTFDLFSLPIHSEPEKHNYTQIIEALGEVGTEPVSSDLKGRIDEMIAVLSENGLADTINYEIWRLGGQKPGDNWGVVHRYDNADVLRQALMIALRRDVHNQFVVKTFPDIEDQNAFYAAIGNCVFDDDEVPSSVDPVAYGKEKIVFHLHQLGRAEATVKRQIEERREQKAHESEEALNQIIEAAIDKNPAAKSIADMIRLINEATGYFAPTGAVEECTAQIRERIENPSFDAALKAQIFLGIWRANGEPLGDSKYGDKHYLDNLQTLGEVLLNILVEIGINGEE